jgi:hypothetical protein
MTRDPKKFREIARVCAVLSKSAVTPEEREIFANLAETWRGMAASTESFDTLLDRDAGADAGDFGGFDNSGGVGL